MTAFSLQNVLLVVFLYFTWTADGLKCRTVQEAQQNNDFEFVVRMCLRHLKNESDFTDLYRFQKDYDSSRNKRHRDDMSNDSGNNNDNGNYYNRNQNKRYPEGFDRFWSPNDRNRQRDEDRSRGDEEYGNGDFDYFNPRSGKNGRPKFKGRGPVPHSYQQQMQHDREMYGHGNREPGNHFSPNRNKNPKFMFHKDKDDDSPLADIDPCVIHCIFQEMKMVDDSGKPNKGLISQKMTQKIRNPELKNFIQDSVEECFDATEDGDDFGGGYNSNSNNNNNNNRYRKQESGCDWAKTFAMCLEDRGRENCDDWNEPIQKNTNYNSNAGNNNNNNNSNNNKNNEDQKHKSKQNDRG